MLVVLWILAGVGVGAAAHARGRSALTFGTLSLVASPLVAAVVLALIGRRTTPPRVVISTPVALALIAAGLLVWAYWLVVL